MGVDFWLMDDTSRNMLDVGRLYWLAYTRPYVCGRLTTVEEVESYPADHYGRDDVARWIREVAGGRPCRLVDDVGDEGYDAEWSGEWTVYTLDPDRDSGPDEWRTLWPPSQPVTPHHLPASGG